MIIVYQSLESQGESKNEESWSVLYGHFKEKTLKSVSKGSIERKKAILNNTLINNSLGSVDISDLESQIFSGKKELVVPDCQDLETEENLKQQYKALKGKGKEEPLREEVYLFLEQVIQSIVSTTLLSTVRTSAAEPGTGSNSPRQPDVIILGELGGSDLEGLIIGDYKVVNWMNPTNDPRHRFAVFQRIGTELDFRIYGYTGPLTDSQNYKNENAKCVIIKAMGWNIACVHTPNNIRTNQNKSQKYYENNEARLGQGEKLDIIVGDTNQQRASFVSELCAKNTGIPWSNSTSKDKGKAYYHVCGATEYSTTGTNPEYDKPYDTVCTPHTHAHIQEGSYDIRNTDKNSPPAFIIHGLTEKFFANEDNISVPYSDHNGLLLEILRPKSDIKFSQTTINTELSPDGKYKFKCIPMEPDKYISSRSITLKTITESAFEEQEIEEATNRHIIRDGKLKRMSREEAKEWHKNKKAKKISISKKIKKRKYDTRTSITKWLLERPSMQQSKKNLLLKKKGRK